MPVTPRNPLTVEKASLQSVSSKELPLNDALVALRHAVRTVGDTDAALRALEVGALNEQIASLAALFDVSSELLSLPQEFDRSLLLPPQLRSRYNAAADITVRLQIAASTKARLGFALRITARGEEGACARDEVVALSPADMLEILPFDAVQAMLQQRLSDLAAVLLRRIDSIATRQQALDRLQQPASFQSLVAAAVPCLPQDRADRSYRILTRHSLGAACLSTVVAGVSLAPLALFLMGVLWALVVSLVLAARTASDLPVAGACAGVEVRERR